MLWSLSTYIGDLELVNLLQMLSEDLDEILRSYVLYGVDVFVDQRKVLLHAIDRQTFGKRHLPPFLLDYAIFIK